MWLSNQDYTGEFFVWVPKSTPLVFAWAPPPNATFNRTMIRLSWAVTNEHQDTWKRILSSFLTRYPPQTEIQIASIRYIPSLDAGSSVTYVDSYIEVCYLDPRDMVVVSRTTQKKDDFGMKALKVHVIENLLLEIRDKLNTLENYVRKSL